METVKLEMNFQDGLEKTFRLILEEPRSDLNQTQIQEAMTDIITNNIFDSKGQDLVLAKGARIITTNVDLMEF